MLVLLFLILIPVSLSQAKITADSTNPVSSDSNIDASANIGSTNSSFLDSQSLNSQYQGITEGNGAGYISPNDIEDFTDNDADSQPPSDLGTYSDFNESQDSDLVFNTLTEENTGGAGSDSVESHDAITDNFSPSDLGTYSSDSNMLVKDGTDNLLTEENTDGVGSDNIELHDAITDTQSPSDIGTYSDDSNMLVKDGTDNLLTEGNGAGYVAGSDNIELHDAITDTQSPSDLGTYSSDSNMLVKDGTDNLLTEENTGGGGGSEYLYPNALSGGTTTCTTSGSSPYIDARDEPTNIFDCNANAEEMSWFNFPDTTLTGLGITVNITVFCNNDDGAGNDGVNIWVDVTGGGSGTDEGKVCDVGTTYTEDFVLVDNACTLTLCNWFEVNLMRLKFIYARTGGADNVRVDEAKIGVSKSGDDNYEFDREFSFTSLVTDETNEYLNFFTGTVGTETLLIDIWTGSWTNIGSIVDANDNTWVNISISAYLDSSTEYFRFIGNSESSDTTLNTWEIDYIEIHSWTDAVLDYEFDREFSFTSLVTDETNEYLNFFLGTIGTEILEVYIWTGSWTWITNIASIASDDWVNISISAYLDSSTEYFRLLSDDESGDTTLNTWEIDYIEIHSWTDAVNNYEFDREFSFSGLTPTDTNEYLNFFTGTVGTETLLIDIWTGSWTNIGSIVDANDNTWVNISISAYLDFSTEYFRFVGNSESSDTTLNTWEIDYIEIHTWTVAGNNYEFDREFSFSSLDFGEPNEELSIRTGIIGTETLLIDIWTGSWTNIGSIVDANDNTWVNISISAYLDSSTEYFRFIGNSESSDTTQNTFELDSILIHSWTNEVLDYELDWEHQSTSIPASDNYEIAIYGKSTEDIDIFMWNVTSSDWNTTKILTISSVDQWYNASVTGAGLIGGTMTWNFRDIDRSLDSSQSDLSIDFSGIITSDEIIPGETPISQVLSPMVFDWRGSIKSFDLSDDNIVFETITEDFDLEISGSLESPNILNLTENFDYITSITWNLKFVATTLDTSKFGVSSALTNGINAFYDDSSLLDNDNLTKTSDFSKPEFSTYYFEILSDESSNRILLSRWIYTGDGLLITPTKNFQIYIQDDLSSLTNVTEFTASVEGYIKTQYDDVQIVNPRPNNYIPIISELAGLIVQFWQFVVVALLGSLIILKKVFA